MEGRRGRESEGSIWRIGSEGTGMERGRGVEGREGGKGVVAGQREGSGRERGR